MLIWGTRTNVFVLAVTQFVCRVCGRNSPQRVLSRVTKFTLFFLPLFTTSKTFHVECLTCGATSHVSEDYAVGAAEWFRAKSDQGSAPAVAASPTAKDVARSQPDDGALVESPNPAEQLRHMRRLEELHSQGVLTREEFDSARARLLNG